MGVLEIIDWCPGNIWFVSSRYLMVVMEIFDGYPAYISWVSLRY